MWTAIETAFLETAYAKAVAPAMRAQAALVWSLLDEIRRRATTEDLHALEDQLVDEYGRLARMVGVPAVQHRRRLG